LRKSSKEYAATRDTDCWNSEERRIMYICLWTPISPEASRLVNPRKQYGSTGKNRFVAQDILHNIRRWNFLGDPETMYSEPGTAEFISTSPLRGGEFLGYFIKELRNREKNELNAKFF